MDVEKGLTRASKFAHFAALQSDAPIAQLVE